MAKNTTLTPASPFATKQHGERSEADQAYARAYLKLTKETLDERTQPQPDEPQFGSGTARSRAHRQT